MFDKQFKTWQKFLLLFFVLGFMASLTLFLPRVQNLILDFGDRVAGHTLFRSVWNRRIIRLGMSLCAIFCILIVLLLPVQFTRKQFGFDAKGKILSLARKPLFVFSVLYIALLVIGFFLMCLAYSLPVEMMQENLKDSVPYFRITEQIGKHQSLMEEDYASRLDDFTDALMLIEAAYKSEHIIPVAAMLNERPSVNDKNPYQTLVSIYGDDNKDFNVVSYGRYWHGYEIFLKPLLFFTTYSGIRWIMIFFQIALVICFIIILVRKSLIVQIIPFLGMWIFLNPPTMMISLQYNTIFVITMIALILIASFYKSYYDFQHNKLFYLYYFFIVGCLTSYFDFLTFPLLTFGVPVIFLISLNGRSFKENFVFLVKCAILWLLGYVFMWGGKWILGSIVTKTNILVQAQNAITFRASSKVDSEAVSYFKVVFINLKKGVLVPMLFAAFAIFIFNTRRNLCIQRKDLIFLVTALMPFAWYMVVKNHSYIHSWFTYRILGITVFSILMLCISMRKNNS